MTLRKLLPEQRQPARSASAPVFCLNKMAFLGISVAGFLGGCAQAPTTLYEPLTSRGFVGAVVADEPTAARVGRDMMARGGSAADAAVAMIFTQVVTLPTSVGFGGGGVCLLFDPVERKAEVIDFSPKPTAGGRMGVPTMVRGLATLGATYGKLGWSAQLEPAENLARSGIQVSPALFQELSEPDSIARLDPAAASIYSSSEGVALREGASAFNAALTATIVRLRRFGAGDFYRGGLSARFIDGARSIGGDLTMEELRDYLPQTGPATRIDIGGVALLLPGGASVGGRVAADVIGLALAGNYAGMDQPARTHLMAEATQRALTAETARRAGRDVNDSGALRLTRLARGFDLNKAGPNSSVAIPGSAAPVGTVIAAMDRLGGAVACALTQGPRFASGRLAGDTGVLVGPPPSRDGLISLVPFLAADLTNNRTIMAAASTGGAMAPTGAAQLALGVLIERRGLEALLERPRMAHDGTAVLLEDFGGDSALALEDRGHKLKVLPQTGRINALLCAQGLPSTRPQCEARPDPRARGLGVGGE